MENPKQIISRNNEITTDGLNHCYTSISKFTLDMNALKMKVTTLYQYNFCLLSQIILYFELNIAALFHIKLIWEIP